MPNFNSVDDAVHFLTGVLDKAYGDLMDHELIGHLRQRLAQRGIHPVYSDAVFYNNKGIVLAGIGGTGKSEMSDRFVQQGASYLSQDFAWLLVENERPVIINTRSENPERASLDFLFWIEQGGVQGFTYFELEYFIDIMFEKYPVDIKRIIQKFFSGVAMHKYNTGEEGARETFDSLNGMINSC